MSVCSLESACTLVCLPWCISADPLGYIHSSTIEYLLRYSMVDTLSRLHTHLDSCIYPRVSADIGYIRVHSCIQPSVSTVYHRHQHSVSTLHQARHTIYPRFSPVTTDPHSLQQLRRASRHALNEIAMFLACVVRFC